MTYELLDSLERAKRELRQNFKSGATCPCCGQNVKAYDRKLTGSQAKGLINLARLYVRDHKWHHVSDLEVSGNGGEFAQLRRWLLIEQQVNEDTKKRTSGMWKPTQKGMDFVYNKITVPSHCETYNNVTMSFSEDQINIRQALGKRFDYAELMGFLL